MTTEKHLLEKPNKAKVFIVDDHPIVRRGLAELINQELDLAVCGESEGAQEALEAIETLKPDLAIVDISLKGTSGTELIKNIKVQDAKLPILVVSMYEESLYAERALRAGARGYIMKQEMTEKVVAAIRRVLNGEIYLSDQMAGKILHKLVGGKQKDLSSSPVDRLTNRELEVFQLIGRGLGTQQIAQELHRSVKTIESHREHIKEKLQLKNASELVQHAVQWAQNPPA